MVGSPKARLGWHHIERSIALRGSLTKATVVEASRRSSTGENIVLKLVDLPSKFFAYPDTTDMTFENGNTLYLLPLRSTLRRAAKQEWTKAERLVGTPIVILEGIIAEPVPKVDASYRRVGRFVVDSLDYIGFFGLLAIPPYPGGKSTKVVVDGTQTSLITLV